MASLHTFFFSLKVFIFSCAFRFASTSSSMCLLPFFIFSLLLCWVIASAFVSCAFSVPQCFNFNTAPHTYNQAVIHNSGNGVSIWLRSGATLLPGQPVWLAYGSSRSKRLQKQSVSAQEKKIIQRSKDWKLQVDKKMVRALQYLDCSAASSRMTPRQRALANKTAERRSQSMLGKRRRDQMSAS